jgi:HEPN domain-containing protein
VKEGEILKIRAERFLETARDLYKKEYYDLCAFNIKQAVKLFLEYETWKIIGDIFLEYLIHAIRETVGDFEKTYTILKLLYYYKKASGKVEEIDSLKEKYKITICNLDFYIENIYLPAQPSKEQIDLMFKFVEDLLSIFKNR